MKYILPFILLLSGAHVSFAQSELISDAETTEELTDEEVVNLKKAEAAAVWDINDSLNYIPAFDEYCDWNSDRVHPYTYSLTDMADTIVIPLAYDSCSFAAPFIGRKTSDFGYRRYRHHYGVDIKLYTGDPVLNAFDGVVRVAKYDGDYGRVVVVRHNNGLETLYAHLSELKVKQGEWVDAGTVVGLGGNTGRSTGSHLHFEVRYLGEPIDPNEIIDWELGMLCSDTLLLNQEHFEYLKEIRKRKYHRIRRGDTLSGIARRYGTTVGKICRLNGMRSTSTLRIGKTIRYN